VATFPAVLKSPYLSAKKVAIRASVFSHVYNNAIDLVDKKAQENNIACSEKVKRLHCTIVINKSLNKTVHPIPQPEREVFNSHVEELEEYLSDVLLNCTMAQTMLKKSRS